MMELFYDYMDLEQKIKNKLFNLPTRSLKSKSLQQSLEELHTNSFQFHPQRPDSSYSKFSQYSVQYLNMK